MAGTVPGPAGDRPTAATAPFYERSVSGVLVLERYRLERVIGRGGHGSVWEALDERLERRVAVKIIPRVAEAGANSAGRLADRAEREGRIAARLGHPAIVTLYELGADEQNVYLVSELVHGRTFAELAPAGVLSDRDVATIGTELCSALEHAHRNGVIHRDVKPQNVMVVAEPAAGAGSVKLTDFGVAHLSGETLTATGDVVGTLAYMAPEQAEGLPVTTAADVYSLGVLLYEAFAGSGPEGAVAARLAGRRPAPLRERRPDLPGSLCAVIDAALDPRPEERTTLADIEEELHAATGELAVAGGLVERSVRRRFGIPGALGTGRRPLPVPHPLLQRLAAGVAAGLLVTAALGLLVSVSPVASPAGAGVAATALVALLPRVGWIASAVAVLAWLVSPAVGEWGTALVLLAALAPVPVLLPRAGLLWSTPALAPLLGAASLAPAFPALAGLASTAWRRAGLAAAGFGWLLVAEVLIGERLLAGPPGAARAPSAWDGSLLSAALDAIRPLLTAETIAAAIIWIGLALILPLLVRGRSPAADVGGAALWAAALVGTQAWLSASALSGATVAEPGVVVAGAVVGGAAAVVGTAIGVPRWASQPTPSRRMIPEGPVR